MEREENFPIFFFTTRPKKREIRLYQGNVERESLLFSLPTPTWFSTFLKLGVGGSRRKSADNKAVKFLPWQKIFTSPKNMLQLKFYQFLGLRHPWARMDPILWWENWLLLGGGGKERKISDPPSPPALKNEKPNLIWKRLRKNQLFFLSYSRAPPTQQFPTSAASKRNFFAPRKNTLNKNWGNSMVEDRF